MAILGTLASLVLICLVLWEGFEVMVLPRRVTRPYRFTRFFYRGSWIFWRVVARRLPAGKRRQSFLGVYGPLSLLALFSSWVTGLIIGFALLHWSLGTALSPDWAPDFINYLYLNGVTFLPLGYGDVTPADSLGRFLAVVESGIGFGFVAVIIGYLPVLYQAFSRREVTISLLDARAGSPPSAAQILVRLGQAYDAGAAADPFLAEWERWAAEVLESHLSFPVLSYYRSQHDNQSWLAALTAVLDTCALLIAGAKEVCSYQAQLTFAMARHVAVDLALVFRTPPRTPQPDRLTADQWLGLRGVLREAGVPLNEGTAAERKLAELRGMYEPFVSGLGEFFLFALPPIFPEKPAVDNWQTSAWMRRTPGIGKLPVGKPGDEHFD